MTGALLKPEWKGKEAAFLRRADALMQQHGLGDWGLYDRPSTIEAAGLCQTEECVLWFSVKRLALASIAEQTDTILHEIAHALCRTGGHDKKWAQTAQRIGMSPGHVLLDLVAAIRTARNATEKRHAKAAYKSLIRGMRQQTEQHD